MPARPYGAVNFPRAFGRYFNDRFGVRDTLIRAQATVRPVRVTERLDGAYPYESGTGKITAEHLEYSQYGKRLFYGDTVL